MLPYRMSGSEVQVVVRNIAGQARQKLIACPVSGDVTEALGRLGPIVEEKCDITWQSWIRREREGWSGGH